MKIAICFSGQPRFVESGYKTLSKNLVGFQDMDIFVHSWANSTKGNNDRLTKLDDTQSIIDIYKLTDYFIEEQRYDIGPQIPHSIFVHYSMFYSIYVCNMLKKRWEETQGIKYDYVIRTRFDIALLSKLDVYNFPKQIVNSPNVCTNPRVISDWFNFSDSNTMDTYCDAYVDMGWYQKNDVKMDSGEEIILAHLNKNFIETNKIDVDLRLIRSKETRTHKWIGIDSLEKLL